MSLVVKRVCHAPPALVFTVYTDPSRLVQWQPGLRGLLDQTGPLDRPGSSYALDQPGPRLTIRVVRVDAPHFHEQLQTLRWYSWITTARFEPMVGRRTRLSFRYSPRPRGFGWLLAPLLVTAGFIFMRREVDRLSIVAERRPSPSPRKL